MSGIEFFRPRRHIWQPCSGTCLLLTVKALLACTTHVATNSSVSRKSCTGPTGWIQAAGLSIARITSLRKTGCCSSYSVPYCDAPWVRCLDLAFMAKEPSPDWDVDRLSPSIELGTLAFYILIEAVEPLEHAMKSRTLSYALFLARRWSFRHRNFV